jgi:hypothetical protein
MGTFFVYAIQLVHFPQSRSHVGRSPQLSFASRVAPPSLPRRDVPHPGYVIPVAVLWAIPRRAKPWILKTDGDQAEGANSGCTILEPCDAQNRNVERPLVVPQGVRL